MYHTHTHTHPQIVRTQVQTTYKVFSTNIHAQDQMSACQIEFVICVEERSILWEMILVL